MRWPLTSAVSDPSVAVRHSSAPEPASVAKFHLGEQAQAGKVEQACDIDLHH